MRGPTVRVPEAATTPLSAKVQESELVEFHESTADPPLFTMPDAGDVTLRLAVGVTTQVFVV